jgi:SAM-dependent methyltransferase
MTSVQVDTSHYSAQQYNSPERYYSFVEQLIAVQRFEPRNVIEIGTGNGFVARELRTYGMCVCTVDIDADLNPNCLASVTALPFKDDACDLSFCCQVLEHLPFDLFAQSMSEIARVSRRNVVISLPDASPSLRLELTRGSSRVFRSRVSLDKLAVRAPKAHTFDGQHYWEIGKAGYPLDRILQSMQEAGLEVLENYRLHLNPYHHFFLLKKRTD